jgi:alkane 1-monooxygenase
MTRSLFPFAFATLTPAILLAGGAIWGGFWVVGAVFFLTAMTSLLDRVIKREVAAGDAAGDDILSIIIALVHLGLMPLVVWALTSDHLVPLAKVGVFFAAGLWFGQVSNANAHELIHRSTRPLHRLGMWVYITMLFGHHTSAHVLVHHHLVATPEDPNTSRKGESLYAYVVRAWVGSFRMGYRAEATRLSRIGRPAWRNPYLVYVGGALVCVGMAGIAGGLSAVFAYLGLCVYAQLQLLMSDYVQHYGLMRARGPDGKYVPVSDRHSWNSPHWFSSALMLNATRHSDHHARPAQHYPALDIADQAPILPRPLPLMASIALVPPLWRKIMDPRVARMTHA